MERLAWILLFLFFHLHVPARAEDDVDRAAQRAFVDWPTSNMTHVPHDPPQYMLDVYEKYKTVRDGVLHDVRAYFDKDNSTRARCTDNGACSQQTFAFRVNASSAFDALQSNKTGTELTNVTLRALLIGSSKESVRVRVVARDPRRRHATRLCDQKVVQRREGEDEWVSIDVFQCFVGLFLSDAANVDRQQRTPVEFVVTLTGVNVPSVPVRFEQASRRDRPLLVVFQTELDRGWHVVGTRFRRSSATKASSRKQTGRRGRRRRMGPCQLKSHLFDLDKLGWDWVLSPKRIYGNYCEGECLWPLDQQKNPTRHAILQTAVRKHENKSVPRACCVPTKLETVGLLYVNMEEELTFKNYDDMVATECGCR
ncbi:protein decapentaplegic-like [Oscarella lobularis]|uniref:protein decapentaplegic-like n=1 Tax=Oscarella lobularis TaxID=121494 RepID=UPI0033142DC1